ncbi:hypothetical protein J437_LFUL001794 [Ladona fulva]|uniref:Uncharacterized protein n=1 Tax=Ladona fulva TaxID=123851 RepID=A0A8K0JYE6_LADFU|nr:hypothetical protein J437_LFUL001794 [Ladona fulva]
MKLTRKHELAAEKEQKEREMLVEVKEEKDDKKISIDENNRLKSMRLLHFLLDKARVRMEEELNLKGKKKLINGTKKKKKEATPVINKHELVHKEKELRRKLLLKYKSLVVKKLEKEERKVKDMIGTKKHLPDDGFSTDTKHCSDEEGINFNRDSSTEVSSLSGELRAVAPEIPATREVIREQKQSLVVDFPKCNVKSEDVLSDIESVREDVFQAICDPDNPLLTRNYVDSLSDFCQRHLSKEAPETVSSRTSCKSQSDEDIHILRKKFELKRKISQQEDANTGEI